MNWQEEELKGLSREERRKKFMQYLNNEGIYYEFKEELKRKLVYVVREQFSKTPSTENIVESDYYSKLYVYLMEQVTMYRRIMIYELQLMCDV